MESGRKAHENGPDEAVRDLGREQLLNCLDQRQERSLIKADQNLRFATMKVHKALSSFPLRAKWLRKSVAFLSGSHTQQDARGHEHRFRALMVWFSDVPQHPPLDAGALQRQHPLSEDITSNAHFVSRRSGGHKAKLTGEDIYRLRLEPTRVD